MTRTPFAADRFAPTPHSTPEEKARFCDTFVRFVLRGFDRKLFTTRSYHRLSNLFGHIANYDETGFWEVWFATPAKQRLFVQRVHEWVAMGDPHFCWSDVERELKSWVVANAEAVEAVLIENEKKAEESAKSETNRRAALVAKTCQQFTVMAKSTNLGGLGHRQYILGAQNGAVWIVHRIYLYPWQVGQVVNVPILNGEPDWCAIQGVECPERLPNCLQPVMEA